MFGYQIQEGGYNKFQPFCPKRTKKGAIIDERFNHGDKLPITSQMFSKNLVILIIPLGTNNIYGT
jgi:hypothetical protein